MRGTNPLPLLPTEWFNLELVVGDTHRHGGEQAAGTMPEELVTSVSPSDDIVLAVPHNLPQKRLEVCAVFGAWHVECFSA